MAPKTPSASHRARVQRALRRLHHLEEQGKCHVWYTDASGFCLQPLLPYLWQLKGHTVGLPSHAHSKRLNVLGFLRRDGHLQSVTTSQAVQAEHFIAAVERLLPTLSRPSVLVVDNASVHRSRAVQQKRAEWKQSGVRLLFLPPYSPHLNKIEILWRLMKYRWLSPSAYADFDTLCQSVTQLLALVGTTYRISFA